MPVLIFLIFIGILIPMEIEKTSIDGILVIRPKVFGDDRGFFLESFNADRYRDAGIDTVFVQDNLSQSKRGVLRGLHFQTGEYAQGKLVQVIKGRVWDVAVDIREGSKTYGKWFGIELSGENHTQFWIPPGLAHGFVTLEDDTVFSYKCTKMYAPEHEGGIVWNDPVLAIEWPIDPREVIVSEKDARNPKFVV